MNHITLLQLASRFIRSISCLLAACFIAHPCITHAAQQAEEDNDEAEDQSGFVEEMFWGTVERHPLQPFGPEPKNLVAFVGKTGAGKSTTINYLLDYLQNGRIVLKKGVAHKAAPMGNAVESVTSVPQVYWNELEGPGGMALLDCPGFDDTRGVEQDVFNIVGIRYAVEQAESIRAIACIVAAADLNIGSYCSGRGQVFVNIVKHLDYVLGGAIPHIDNILFLVTKCPPHTQKNDIVAEIKKLKSLADNNLGRLEKTLPSAAVEFIKNSGGVGGWFRNLLKIKPATIKRLTDALGTKELLDAIVQRAENIFVVDVLDNGQSRHTIHQRLRAIGRRNNANKRSIPKNRFTPTIKGIDIPGRLRALFLLEEAMQHERLDEAVGLLGEIAHQREESKKGGDIYQKTQTYAKGLETKKVQLQAKEKQLQTEIEEIEGRANQVVHYRTITEESNCGFFAQTRHITYDDLPFVEATVEKHQDIVSSAPVQHPCFTVSDEEKGSYKAAYKVPGRWRDRSKVFVRVHFSVRRRYLDKELLKSKRDELRRVRVDLQEVGPAIEQSYQHVASQEAFIENLIASKNVELGGLTPYLTAAAPRLDFIAATYNFILPGGAVDGGKLLLKQLVHTYTNYKSYTPKLALKQEPIQFHEEEEKKQDEWQPPVDFIYNPEAGQVYEAEEVVQEQGLPDQNCLQAVVATLKKAIQFDNLEEFEDLFSQLLVGGYSINTLDQYNKTLLDYAMPQSRVYAFLQTNGGLPADALQPSLSVQEDKGGQPNQDNMDFLGKEDNENQDPPLHAAVKTQSLATAKLVFSANPALLNEPDVHGKTPLDYAQQDSPLYHWLTLQGGQHSQVTTDEESDNEEAYPFHAAVEENNLGMVKKLFKFNTRFLNQPDHGGRTPLDYAEPDSPLYQWLANKGAKHSEVTHTNGEADSCWDEPQPLPDQELLLEHNHKKIRKHIHVTKGGMSYEEAIKKGASNYKNKSYKVARKYYDLARQADSRRFEQMQNAQQNTTWRIWYESPGK